MNPREEAVTIVDLIGIAIARIEINRTEILLHVLNRLDEYFVDKETRELKEDLKKFVKKGIEEREGWGENVELSQGKTQQMKEYAEAHGLSSLFEIKPSNSKFTDFVKDWTMKKDED